MTLIVADDHVDPGAAAGFGGVPMVPAAAQVVWPTCRVCEGPQQYLGYVPHPTRRDRRVMLFQCNNEPGVCGEWEPDGGANLAVVVDSTPPMVRLEPPTVGVTGLDGSWTGHLQPSDAPTYEAARNAAREAGRARSVLGHVGGDPEWLQGDETPICPACGHTMVLAAQIEQGPHHKTEINFGGGCAYVFTCDCPGETAILLSQC